MNACVGQWRSQWVKEWSQEEKKIQEAKNAACVRIGLEARPSLQGPGVYLSLRGLYANGRVVKVERKKKKNSDPEVQE